MDYEIKKRIKSIITTSIFLIVSTILWMSSNTTNSASLALYNDIQKLQLIETSEPVKLQNVYPTDDQTGLQNKSYNFNIVNNGINTETYNIYFINDLDKTKYNLLPYNAIRYQVIKNGEVFISATNLNKDGLLFSDEINVSETNKYEFIFWLDENSTNDIMGTSFNGKVTLK